MSESGVNDQDLVAGLARIGYARARRLLILAGLVILAVVVAGLLARSVDHVEVVGTLLFVPIFVCLMFFGVTGGLVAGGLATACYVALRLDAIDAVGWGEFSGVVISRGLGYLLFGIAGGWAASTLELSLEKLDLYDHVDDLTGLHNARFLLHDVGLEQARAERYQSVFSVCFVQVPAAEFEALSVRRRRRLWRDLGSIVEASVRSIDRVAHGTDGRVHHLAAVLPETAAEGAAVFLGRLLAELRSFASAHDLDVEITGNAYSIPGDESPLEVRLTPWRVIEAASHPTPEPANS